MERVTFNKESVSRNSFAISEVTAESRKIRGYVAKWEVISGLSNGEYSLFRKGSMSLPDFPVTLQYNHNDTFMLRNEDDGLLYFTADDIGVYYEAELDDTYLDNYLLTKIAKGTIKGASVGMIFFTPDVSYERIQITPDHAKDNPELVKLIGKTIKVTIYNKWILEEITITGRPAFPQTTAEIFSTDKRDMENIDEEIRSLLLEAEIIGLELD